MNKTLKFSSFVFFVFFLSAEAYASDFIYGIGGHPNSFKGTSLKYSKIIEGLGFTSFRTDYYWSNLERSKGNYIVPRDKYQQVIDNLASNGVKPLLILGYNNRLYFEGKPNSVEKYSEFANYAAWVCRKYKYSKPVLQVWNEWSIDKHNQTAARSLKSAQNYVELVKAVSKKISNISDCTLIAGDFNPNIPDDLKWGENLLSLGILSYIDGLSIHAYSFKPLKIPSADENIKTIINLHEKIQLKYKKDIPIYITEVGLPTYNWTRYNPIDVANYAKKYFSLARENKFIKGVWWYDLIDDGDNKNNGEFNFGIMRHDGTDKGNLSVFKTLRH